MRKLLIPLIGGMLVLGTVAASPGRLTVLFEDGRALSVSDVERTNQTALLTLEGGGQIAVPADRILNWPQLDCARDPRVDMHRNVQIQSLDLETVGHAAIRHGLDPVLLRAVAGVETDPGPAGGFPAQGPLRLRPEIAHRLGVTDTMEADQVVESVARHLRELLEKYNGRTDLAVAAYNAGEDAVDRYRGVPPYGATRQFVNRVLTIVKQSARPLNQ